MRIPSIQWSITQAKQWNLVCAETHVEPGVIISRRKRQYHMPLPIYRNGNGGLAEERVDQWLLGLGKGGGESNGKKWGQAFKAQEEGPFWFSIAQRAATGKNTAMFQDHGKRRVQTPPSCRDGWCLRSWRCLSPRLCIMWCICWILILYPQGCVYNRPFTSVRPFTKIYVLNYCAIGANVMDNQTEERLNEVENTSRQRVQLRTGW